jgi:hypothetical protein
MRSEFEVDAELLANLCNKISCGIKGCDTCALFDPKPEDEIVLRIKKPIKPTGKVQVGS